MTDKWHNRYAEIHKGPTFDEIDRKDPVAFAAAREKWVLDRLVELETVKILRENMQQCYRKEEVNARQNCKKEVLDYMEAFRNYRAKGLFSFRHFTLFYLIIMSVHQL